MEIIKHTKNNGTLLIKEIGYYQAKEMIVNNHYSKKWMSQFGKINIGIFKNNKCLGVAVFGNLMNPESYDKIANIEKNQILELNRMWVDDKLKKNAETILISSSFKIIKKLYPNIKIINTFADGRLGCGTIYKAANFKYYGYHETYFFKDKVTHEVFHKMAFERVDNPNTLIKLLGKYIDDNFVTFKVKTYRYLYILDKKVKVKLKEKKYPIYEKGITEEKYNIGINNFVKALIISKINNEENYYNKFEDYLTEILQKENKEILIKNNLENKYIKKYLKDKHIKDYFNYKMKIQTSIFDFL